MRKSHETPQFLEDTAVLELVHDVLSFRFSGKAATIKVQMKKLRPRQKLMTQRARSKGVKKASGFASTGGQAARCSSGCNAGRATFSYQTRSRLGLSQAWRPTFAISTQWPSTLIRTTSAVKSVTVGP